MHLLDQCSQNWFAVASLYENTLNEIKKSKPEIVEVFTRSDNAGCYHCAFLLLSIPGISQRTGIKTKRYDFSESNSGKDICDRHISPMKSHIRQYVNEGNDVENAGDMKKTLDSHHGVKGCHISVVKLETNRQGIHKHTWKGIQAMSNFEFCKESIRMCQGDTGLVIVEPFATPRVSVGCLRKAAGGTDNNDGNGADFNCPETGCIKMFKSNKELQRHVETGRHQFHAQKDTAYDTIKRNWATACTSVRSSYVQAENGDLKATHYPTAEHSWALRKTKSSTRFSKHVKEHLLKLFLEGEKTGNKYDPSVVASSLKTTRAANGKKLFPQSDWLSSQQIASYFSRLAVIARSGKLVWETKEILQEDENLQALVDREQRNSMLSQIFQDLDS